MLQINQSVSRCAVCRDCRCPGCRQCARELGRGLMPVHDSHRILLAALVLELPIVWFQQQEKLEKLPKIRHGCEIAANFQKTGAGIALAMAL